MITFAKLGQLGRLGNCLFQIAATASLAARNNDDYILPASWKYKNDFNIPENKFSNNIKFSKTYEEPNFHYNQIPYSKNLNLHGYFQSSKYFSDQEALIRDILKPKLFDKVSFIPNVASIHVRRTDYLKLKGCYEILDMDYYERAMSSTNCSNFLVFSDDIDWCKSVFKGNQFSFMENNSAMYDFCVMMKCQDNIIANSSFSWWAAYLNPNSNKKVIAPKKWFGPKLSTTHNAKDLIPDDWEKV